MEAMKQFNPGNEGFGRPTKNSKGFRGVMKTRNLDLVKMKRHTVPGLNCSIYLPIGLSEKKVNERLRKFADKVNEFKYSAF